MGINVTIVRKPMNYRKISKVTSKVHTEVTIVTYVENSFVMMTEHLILAFTENVDIVYNCLVYLKSRNVLNTWKKTIHKNVTCVKKLLVKIGI